MVSVKDVDDIPKAVLDAMLSIDGYALQATPEEVDLTDAEKAGLEAEAEGETPAPESHQETVKLQTKRSASKAKTTKSGA